MTDPTKTQRAVIIALDDLGPGAHGPTKIGELCGKSYTSASSWAQAPLKALVRMGYVRRFGEGLYQLTSPHGADMATQIRGSSHD